MIPWMREKFAEKKAKWEASRKRNNFSSDNIEVSDKIPLQRDVSYDPIEIFENESHRDAASDDTILLNIISYDGRIANLRLSSTATIDELKFQALKEFKIIQTDDDQGSFVQNYKLSKATKVMLDLNESLSICQNDLSDRDELLLIKFCNNEIVGKNNFQRGPSQREIDKLTAERIACGEKSIPIVNINDIVLNCNVQNDIRKLLISLAKSSAFVIGASPFATQLILMFKQRLIRRNANDLHLLESLPQYQIQKFRRDNYVSDMWLHKIPTAGTLELNEQSSKAHIPHSSIYENTKSNIQALLEIIRIYSYKYITPKSNFEEVIWEMGSKHDVQEALTINENNYAEACKWLMRTQENHNDGLLKDSPILKALLISPHIQLSLSSPKVFIAYLSILDNYASINLWLSDAETAGVIGHILRTYHEEKHILAINQIS